MHSLIITLSSACFLCYICGLASALASCNYNLVNIPEYTTSAFPSYKYSLEGDTAANSFTHLATGVNAIEYTGITLFYNSGQANSITSSWCLIADRVRK